MENRTTILIKLLPSYFPACFYISLHGNTFHITGPLWRDPPVTSGFPSQRASMLFSLLLVLTSCWTNCGIAADVRCLNTHVPSVVFWLQGISSCSADYAPMPSQLVMGLTKITLSAVKKGKTQTDKILCQWSRFADISGLILGLCPANERCRYKVTPSLISWTQA